MAIVITSNSGKTHYALRQYICDTNADIVDLPIDNVWIGSTAFVIESGETYMLNSALNWVKVELGGGGGSSSEDLQTVAENFAPAYDETQTYSVGDLVVYQYVLYKCITAVSTPEEFDDTKWEYTTLESSFEIDDSDVSAVKTWSSSKLSELTLPDATSSDENKLISVDASGNYELRNTIDIGRIANSTIGTNSTAEGSNTIASGNYSHAEGTYTKASGAQSHVEGKGIDQIYISEAHGLGAHVEGYSQKIPYVNVEQGTSGYSYLVNSAQGTGAHAEGSGTKATGNYSHAEGKAQASDLDGQVINIYALGEAAHAEGLGTHATGEHSHSEGELTTASGDHGSHAEGSNTTASAYSAHAEGSNTTASGAQSHSEGNGTIASGIASHTEGTYTTANHKSQHVFGEYNTLDDSAAEATARGNYIEIVGNGTGTSARSNARTLDWSGNEVLAGKLTVGAQPTAANDVTTKTYVDAISTDVQASVEYLDDYLGLTGGTLIHRYDFTKNANDEIGSMNLNSSTGTFTSNGFLLGGISRLELNSGTFIPTNSRIVIQFGTTNYTSGGALISRYSNGVVTCLYYDSTDGWCVLSDGTTTKLNIASSSFFNNKTLIIKVGDNYNDVTMATPEGQIYKGAFNFTSSLMGFAPFTWSTGMLSSQYIKTLEIYTSSGGSGNDVVTRINNLESSYNSFITGTILTGEDTLTIQNASITSSTMFDIYSSVYSIVPDEVTVATGSITLSFDTAVESDVTYKIRLIEG